MRILLDTHILCWSLSEPEKLNSIVREILDDNDNELWVSDISFFELSIKMNIGKFTYQGGLQELLNDFSKMKIETLQMNSWHLLTYVQLPPHHKDPFDRLLIAQAKAEGMKMVTNDKEFKKYDLEIIWN